MIFSRKSFQFHQLVLLQEQLLVLPLPLLQPRHRKPSLLLRRIRLLQLLQRKRPLLQNLPRSKNRLVRKLLVLQPRKGLVVRRQHSLVIAFTILDVLLRVRQPRRQRQLNVLRLAPRLFVRQLLLLHHRRRHVVPSLPQLKVLLLIALLTQPRKLVNSGFLFFPFFVIMWHWH